MFVDGDSLEKIAGKARTLGLLRKPACLTHQIKKTLQFYKIPVYIQALCWSAAVFERFRNPKSPFLSVKRSSISSKAAFHIPIFLHTSCPAKTHRKIPAPLFLLEFHQHTVNTAFIFSIPFPLLKDFVYIFRKPA